MSSFLTRSTIYDRHEARRAKTILNKDDPRPAVIRVMAGLPGFRAIIPSHQASKNPSLPPVPFPPDETSSTVVSFQGSLTMPNNASTTETHTGIQSHGASTVNTTATMVTLAATVVTAAVLQSTARAAPAVSLPSIFAHNNPALFPATLYGLPTNGGVAAAATTASTRHALLPSVASATEGWTRSVVAKRAIVLFLGVQAVHSVWSTDRRYH